MMCGLPFLVRINVSSCVVFVRIFVEFRRLNVGNYVGEGGYCGDWALKSTKMINRYIGSKNVFIFGVK